MSPAQSVIIGHIEAIATPSLTGTGAGDANVVRFAGDRQARLPEGDRGQILRKLLVGMQRLRLPAYASLRDGADVIESVHSGRAFRVARVTPLPNGDHAVDLEGSAAPRTLSPDVPDFDRALTRLHSASQRNLFVEVFEAAASRSILAVEEGAPPDPEFSVTRHTTQGFPGNMTVLTMAQATNHFERVVSLGCGGGPAETCVPFRYAKEGCEARAQRICEALLSRHVLTGKLWAIGPLTVKTPNDPACEVVWNHHVAPAILVGENGQQNVMIVDPTLFPRGPVEKQEWLARLGNASAVVATHVGAYVRVVDGFREEAFARESDHDLNGLRQKFDELAESSGPPPYGHCHI